MNRRPFLTGLTDLPGLGDTDWPAAGAVPAR